MGKQRKDYVFIALYLNMSMLCDFCINAGILLTGHELEGISLIYKVFSLGMMLCAFLYIFRKNKAGLLIILTSVLAILFVISTFINHSIAALWKKAAYYCIGFVVFPAILLSTVEKPDELLTAYKPYIYISCVFGIVISLVTKGTNDYSMSYSYGTLIPALISWFLFRKTKKLRYILFSLFIILIDILCGSRGCLICFAVAALLGISEFLSLQNRVILFLTLALVMILCIVFWKSIISSLVELFPSSRTISMLSGNGNFFSGRQYYYDKIYSEIIDSKFNIHGLFSDRIIMAEYFGRSSVQEIWSSYTHNIFLEILYQFGWIGIPLILWLVVSVFRSIKVARRNGERGEKFLLIACLSYALGQLIFSSSYLIAISFGMLVGVMLMINNRRKLELCA